MKIAYIDTMSRIPTAYAAVVKSAEYGSIVVHYACELPRITGHYDLLILDRTGYTDDDCYCHIVGSKEFGEVIGIETLYDDLKPVAPRKVSIFRDARVFPVKANRTQDPEKASIIYDTLTSMYVSEIDALVIWGDDRYTNAVTITGDPCYATMLDLPATDSVSYAAAVAAGVIETYEDNIEGLQSKVSAFLSGDLEWEDMNENVAREILRQLENVVD